MRCCGASKLVWGLAICGLVLPAGCASWRRGPSSAGQAEVTTIKPHPKPKGAPALAQATTAKKSVTKASAETTAAPPPGGIDTQSLQEVLAGMNELDPATRQKMLDQLAEVDPALLGPILEQWRAVIAAKKKKANPDALIKAGVQTTEPTTPQPGAKAEPMPPALQPSAKPEPVSLSKLEAGPEGDVLQPHKLRPTDIRGREAAAGPPARLVASETDLEVSRPSGLTAAAKSRPSSPSSWQSMLGDVIAQAEQQRGSATPATAQNEVYLRLLRIAHGDKEKALSPIAGAAPAEQEFWQKTLWAMSSYLDKGGIPAASDRAAETLLHLNEAANRLRADATLQVKNLALCRKIMSYGSFEKFPEYEFTPGQAVLLYAEVENFTSQQTPQGYKTVLKSSLEIQDLQGNQVWPQEFKATEDVCRNQRRDYFHSYQFTIPAKMNAGTYVLKLTVEDESARKVAQGMLKFTIK